MSDPIILLIILLIVMGGLAWVVFWMADAKSGGYAYREEVAEMYREKADGKSEKREVSSPTDDRRLLDSDRCRCTWDIYMDPNELTNRISAFYARQDIDTKVSHEIIHQSNRIVPVTIIDNSELWLKKLGMYDEQCNNFIHLIKADLNLHGMS